MEDQRIKEALQRAMKAREIALAKFNNHPTPPASAPATPAGGTTDGTTDGTADGTTDGTTEKRQKRPRINEPGDGAILASMQNEASTFFK